MTPELYEKMWAHDAYRIVAPGEQLAYRFVEMAKPTGRVIDFGAGTGRGAALIHALANVPVLALDFAANSLDPEVMALDGIEFRKHDLREPVNDFAEWGYCTDVLEHIAPEDVGKVLQNILTAARRVFFAISTQPDHFGPAVAGEPLHLTVKDPFWWHDRLEKLGFKVEWSKYDDDSVCFYGSAWATAQDFSDISSLNESHERVISNIKANLDLGLKEITPHEVQPDTVVYLLAGGPSLKDHEQEIIEAGKRGVPCVTVNGTYNWLIERGVKPAAHVMVDAREFNKRFVTRHFDTCQYFASSQCDPGLVASLPRENAWLWHAGQSDLVTGTLKEWAEETGTKREWYPVFGASTVVSRAVTLLAMLGFRKIEIFGWDSCLKGDEHHAYSQPENDSGEVVTLKVGSREFRCHPWMVVQANEFPKLIRHVYSQVPDLELSVRGDGVIAAILETAREAANGC